MLTERQKTSSEGQYSIFFSRSFDLHCIAGFDGYFKVLNPAWTTRLGWTIDELLARPFSDFVHPDDRDSTAAEVEKLVGGATTILFENRYLHRDGTFRWLQWNASPAPGKNQICATARDLTRTRWLESEILQVTDREKARLGNELHDGLGQMLFGIATLSSSLATRLASTDDRIGSSAATEITRLLNESIAQTRNMARGISPFVLREAGLGGALTELGQLASRLFHVSCTVRVEEGFPRPGSDAELHLLRVAQEAVRNAIRHGNATQISVQLTTDGGRGVMAIHDNGSGIAAHGCDPEGLGSQTMTYRARLMGASLVWNQSKNGGTTLTCRFPIS